jgi:hypothetical protein
MIWAGGAGCHYGQADSCSPGGNEDFKQTGIIIDETIDLDGLQDDTPGSPILLPNTGLITFTGFDAGKVFFTTATGQSGVYSLTTQHVTVVLRPDGLLEQTDMKGALATLTNDCLTFAAAAVEPERPPSDGGSGANGQPCWMIAKSAGSDPVVRVSYPTPASALDSVQTFEARVRKYGGSSTPTARIDLYENGVLLAQGTSTPVTSTSQQVLTQTFNLSSLHLQNANGSGIEARFVAVHAGSGKTRASVDLEYLDWKALLR